MAPKPTNKTARLSAASCWSLIAFGVASLAVSLVALALPGLLIGAALLAHGLFERIHGKLLFRDANADSARRLAWNQMGLAASVSLYLGWQASAVDAEELRAVLLREPVKSALELYPPEIAQRLVEGLPQYVLGFYGLAMIVALLGCVAMAALYLRAGRKLTSASAV